MDLTLIILFGMICGVVLGLTGSGGSIIAVPLLIYVIGLPVHMAITTSLLMVCLVAFSGVLMKRKRNELMPKTASILIATAIVFSPMGAYANQQLPDNMLLIIFSILMLIISLITLRSALVVSCYYSPDAHRVNTVRQVALLAATGSVAGFLIGLLGVGGGFIIVPALLFFTQMTAKQAVTTSKFVIFSVAIVAIISHYLHGDHFNEKLAFIFAFGGVIGMFVAIKLSHYCSERFVKLSIAATTTLIGVAMLITELMM